MFAKKAPDFICQVLGIEGGGFGDMADMFKPAWQRVGGLAALDDGRIVVLERELYFPKKQIGSYCLVKLYVVNPSQQQPGELLNKSLLTTFRTKFNITRHNFANYEGICVGPKLADGRQLLILICDSQNQFHGVMRDWFKTIIMPN